MIPGSATGRPPACAPTADDGDALAAACSGLHACAGRTISSSRCRVGSAARTQDSRSTARARAGCPCLLMPWSTRLSTAVVGLRHQNRRRRPPACGSRNLRQNSSSTSLGRAHPPHRLQPFQVGNALAHLRRQLPPPSLFPARGQLFAARKLQTFATPCSSRCCSCADKRIARRRQHNSRLFSRAPTHSPPTPSQAADGAQQLADPVAVLLRFLLQLAAVPVPRAAAPRPPPSEHGSRASGRTRHANQPRNVSTSLIASSRSVLARRLCRSTGMLAGSQITTS